MPHPFPDPKTRFPIILPDGSPHAGTVFLSAVLDHPRITVGEYTYASADSPPENWAMQLAPYLFPHSPEMLSLGRFCQIAHGATFVTASANHKIDGFSTYPFSVFQGVFSDSPSLPQAGPDTYVGHDVWIGRNVCILPGARVGNGAILGAHTVVGGEIAPYSIVTGNPGEVSRKRFDPEIVARLLDLCWWDWPIDRILANEKAICGADVAVLEAAAP